MFVKFRRKKFILEIREPVSKTLLNDLDYWLQMLRTIYTYDGLIIQDYAPELLIYTHYDIAIPRTGIQAKETSN